MLDNGMRNSRAISDEPDKAVWVSWYPNNPAWNNKHGDRLDFQPDC